MYNLFESEQLQPLGAMEERSRLSRWEGTENFSPPMHKIRSKNVRSHIGWRGERNIPYKSVKTYP